ncbi:phage capsid protein [Ruminococcaceae bacterium OttesenSCG-928-A11]|nr:phage capsid protein [Ruminococcaceae bacterium OttesenSCG-928-A11]
MFTLADAKQLSQDKLTNFVIDEFRKSPLLDALPFDDTVKPQGGNSLTYSYNRVTTLPTAAGRAIGSEYTPQEAKTAKQNVDLKVFGGAFTLDRVIVTDETQVLDLVQFQIQQKSAAAVALFADWFINGDSAADATAFDGLDKALTGSSTELVLSTPLDMSSASAIEANWKAFLYNVRQAQKLMQGAATVMPVNSDMFAIWKTVADYASAATATKTDFGTEVVQYGPTLIMDMGDKPGTSNPIIANYTSGADMVSDIYFARLGLDAVHGVTPDGQKGPKVYVPNMKEPGAVKKGEVEMVAAMAMKATRAAAALRGIKVA